MSKELRTDYFGGMPLSLEDFEHIQAIIFEATKALALGLAGGKNYVIVTGCELIIDEANNTFTSSEGYVFAQVKDGRHEMFRVQPSSGAFATGALPYFEHQLVHTYDAKTFEDGDVHFVHEDRYMRLVFVQPSAVTADHYPYASFKRHEVADSNQLQNNTALISTAIQDIENILQNLTTLNSYQTNNTAIINAIVADIEKLKADVAGNTSLLNLAVIDIESNAGLIQILVGDMEYATRRLVPTGVLAAIGLGHLDDFDEANNWEGKPGTEWGNWILCFGQIPGVPDMRTRTLGGYWPGPPNTDTRWGTLGNIFGSQRKKLGIQHMPSHNHSNGAYTELLRTFKTADNNGTLNGVGDSTQGEPVINESAPMENVGGGKSFDIQNPTFVVAFAMKIRA